jgi:RND family efflux transporter MFP subunit
MAGQWRQGSALVAVTVLAMLGIWAARAWSRADDGGGWQMPPETVTIVTAEVRPWRETRTLLANLASAASVDVRTEVGGRLVQVGFESGAQVQRGAVLARLDAGIEVAELRSAEAELQALTLRRGRTAQLAAENGASQMDLDQVTADVAAATARADALRARIRQKTVVAPFDGRVGVRRHHPGQVVDPGVSLTSLVSTSTALFADFWVPQTLLASLPVGGPVTVRLDGATAEAVVEVVEPSADAARRAVLVRARLDPAPPGWLPAMSAQVDVPTTGEVPRVVVPATALVWSPAGVMVYRVVDGEDGAQTVTANPVEVLSNLGDEVVLASGLDGGTRIATDGAFKLHEGSAVRAAEVARE